MEGWVCSASFEIHTPLGCIYKDPSCFDWKRRFHRAYLATAYIFKWQVFTRFLVLKQIINWFCTVACNESISSPSSTTFCNTLAQKESYSLHQTILALCLSKALKVCMYMLRDRLLPPCRLNGPCDQKLRCHESWPMTHFFTAVIIDVRHQGVLLRFDCDCAHWVSRSIAQYQEKCMCFHSCDLGGKWLYLAHFANHMYDWMYNPTSFCCKDKLPKQVMRFILVCVLCDSTQKNQRMFSIEASFILTHSHNKYGLSWTPLCVYGHVKTFATEPIKMIDRYHMHHHRISACTSEYT